MKVSSADAARLFDGRRLTIARQLAGLRKSDLARQVAKTPTAIASYELRRKRPAASTVAELCIALSVEPSFFLATASSASDGPSVPTPHFRSLRSTPQRVRDRASAYVELANDVVLAVERYVEMPAIDIPHCPLSDVTDKQAALEAARALRQAWRIPPGPAPHLVRTAEHHGVIIIFSPEDAACVDAYSVETNARPIIVLNPLKGDYCRQRFDVGHELGHLVMHADAEPGSREVERQADAFAAELLLPSDEIASELPPRLNWPRLQQLRERWGASMQALLYRGRELGIYSDTTYRNAMMRMSTNGWRRQEPGRQYPVEEPSLLPAALRLLASEGVTEEQVAADASAPIKYFRAITARHIDRSV